MEFVEPIRDKEKIELVKVILKKSGFRNYLLFLLGINCGLRISDILKLKVEDVRNRKHIEIKEQKTGKYRKFLITNSYKEAIKEYITEKEDNEWLFPSQRGDRPITRVQAYRIISVACAKAGIKSRIGTHTLRKTFAYHFYKQKKDVALLQSILNHSSPSITLRYIGINQDIIDKNLKDFSL